MRCLGASFESTDANAPFVSGRVIVSHMTRSSVDRRNDPIRTGSKSDSDSLLVPVAERRSKTVGYLPAVSLQVVSLDARVV